MRMLLDTNVLYRAFYEPDKLSAEAHAAIQSAEAIYVSAASIWELAIKVRLGKLQGDPERIASRLSEAGFRELTISNRHALAVATLPMHHSDPFDRLLVAQAQIEGLRLLTTDGKLAQYGEFVIEV